MATRTLMATRATHATATPCANIREAEALQRRLKTNAYLAIHGQGDSTKGIHSETLSVTAIRATHATATPCANIREAEAPQRSMKTNAHPAIHG